MNFDLSRSQLELPSSRSSGVDETPQCALSAERKPALSPSLVAPWLSPPWAHRHLLTCIEGLVGRCWSLKTGKVFTGCSPCPFPPRSSSSSSSPWPSSDATSPSLSSFASSSPFSASSPASAAAADFRGEVEEGTKGLASAASGERGGVRRSLSSTTFSVEAIGQRLWGKKKSGTTLGKKSEPLSRSSV